MRLFCAAVLALAAGVFAACAADKKDPPKDAPKEAAKDAPKPTGPAAELADLQKKFTEEFNELLKRFQSASTTAEKQGIQTEAKELATLTLGKVLKIAEADPKGPVALDAAQFALARLASVGASGADLDKLIDMVIAHHLGSPKAKELVLLAGRAGKGGEKLLLAAGEKAADKEVRGIALYMLGSSYAEQADDAPSDKAATELTAKAIDFLQRAAKEAPDFKLGPDTLAKAVEGEIQALKTLGIGSPAPDLEGSDLDDKKVKLSSYKGKVVLLDIWATWCGPCRAMIPHERDMVKKLEGKPFVLVSVSADDEKETLTKFIEKEPMPWTHWWAGRGGDVLKTLKVKAFPTLYLIDAKGVIRKKWVGSPPTEVLDKAIEDLVKEAGSKS